MQLNKRSVAVEGLGVIQKALELAAAALAALSTQAAHEAAAAETNRI